MSDQLPSQSSQSMPKALAQTLPEEMLSVKGIHKQIESLSGQQKHLQATVGDNDIAQDAHLADSALLLDAQHLSHKVPETFAPEIFPEEATHERRYALKSLLGSGAMGAVYSVEDLNLQRSVAVKSMKTHRSSGSAASTKAITSLINEARITASLQHSGVLPVHDLDFTNNGEIYYSMRQVEGRSLGEAIEISQASEPCPEIASINDRLNIMIRVCDTIELAHGKGIIHCDIKPDNIMLGKLGEVFVVDWGAALQLDSPDAAKRRRVGTPIFMSPEQARREPPSIQNEVYSIGATLFQLLTFRFHVNARTVEEFWAKKEAGILDPLSKEEKQRIPDPLQAIVLKALDPDPHKRYQRAADLAHDLRNYQAGLAVDAYRDTAWGFCRRWFKRNKQAAMIVLIAFIPVILLSFAGLSVWSDIQAEREQRWHLMYEDTFERSDVGQNWELDKGEADIIDGNLVLSGKGGVEARLMVPHEPLVRLEFEAKIPEGVNLCDMSAYLFTSPGVRDYYYEPAGYLFGFGVSNNTYSVLRRNGQILRLSEDVLIEPEKWHHVVCEKDVSSVRLLIDGQEVMAVKDHYPPRYADKMYVTLYTFNSIMHVRSVKLFSKTIAERAKTIDIADNFFWHGQYEPAAQLFEMVWQDHEGTDLGFAALYRLALCRIEQSRHEDAITLLQSLIDDSPDYGMVLSAQLKKAYTYFKSGAHEQGFALTKRTIQGVSNFNEHSVLTLFFDDTFQLLVQQLGDQEILLPILNEYCNWWRNIHPNHPTITRGKFYYIWSDACRRVGDWQAHKRVLRQAIAEPQLSNKDAFQRALFNAEWRGRWDEERLAASRIGFDAKFYMENLFTMGRFVELRAYFEGLKESGQYEDARAHYEGLLAKMFICGGHVEALTRHLGTHALSKSGKLQLAKCYLIAGDPQTALDHLDLDWKALEYQLDVHNPIVNQEWQIGFLCYAMLGDTKRVDRIVRVAETLVTLQIGVKGSRWFALLAGDLATKKARIKGADKTHNDRAKDSVYVFAAEGMIHAGYLEDGIEMLKATTALFPNSFWVVLANNRLKQIESAD